MHLLLTSYYRECLVFKTKEDRAAFAGLQRSFRGKFTRGTERAVLGFRGCLERAGQVMGGLRTVTPSGFMMRSRAIIVAYLYKGPGTQTSGEKERALNLASSAAALVATP